METTTIRAHQTASEVMSLLVRSGARELSMTYSAEGKLTGLRFTLESGAGALLPFALPIRVEPVFRIFQSRRKSPTPFAARDREQAERVAWRQLLRWVQAQHAMIETGMVEAQEVFLPYILDAASGQTLFEHFAANGMKQLTGGPG